MSMSIRKTATAFLLCFLVGGASCKNDLSNLLGVPPDDTDPNSNPTVDMATPTPPGPTNNVDVLFVVDNSPSMTPKQKALGVGISSFISAFNDLNLDYHIGIVSTDIGTNVAPGTPWGGSIGSCDTYAGDDGVMQSRACTAQTNGTSDARNSCALLCPDDKFVPIDGKRYISKINGVTNVPVAMQLDPKTGLMVDVGPLNAFRCMAMLGDAGCGVESPLESARRALDSHRHDNDGFLRPGSLLAVIFLTDEDDCSVQLARRSENNPITRDCSTPDQDADYDCYNIDYRCLARSVICDQPMNTPGAKTNCKARASSYLEPITTYLSFFSQLTASHRLLVSGIWTMPSLANGGQLTIARGSGGTSSPFLNRAGGQDASCAYAGDVSIFGQAQLRLNTFAAAIPGTKQYSICDIDNLQGSLQTLGKAIADQAKKQ